MRPSKQGKVTAIGAELSQKLHARGRELGPARAAHTHVLIMRAAALLLLAAARAAPPSAVYIMRHCARSTYLPDLEDEKTYPYLANYSDGGELADWGVAPTLCTARGRKIVKGEGAFMKDEFARYDSLKVFHDSGSQRDTTTAADFLAGLGSSVESVAAPEVFNPMKAKFCPYLTEQESAAAVAAQLAVVPEPDALAARVEVLQEVLGAGVAPAMQNISSEVADGRWRGGAAIAAAWIEAMLLQLGAGIPPAYERFEWGNTLTNSRHPPRVRPRGRGGRLRALGHPRLREGHQRPALGHRAARRGEHARARAEGPRRGLGRDAVRGPRHDAGPDGCPAEPDLGRYQRRATGVFFRVNFA